MIAIIARSGAIVAIIATLALAGCTGKPVEVPPVKVTSDSYCKIAKKRTWSVNDTSETIDEARRENAKYESVCEKKSVS